MPYDPVDPIIRRLANVHAPDEIASVLHDLEIYAFDSVRKIHADAASKRFEGLLKRAFHYRFSDADAERIQQLVDELRTMITASTDFEAKHKQRLLSRLERLQQEIHKRVSDLDRFWGLIGDAGVILGKFGRDAKPIVDRIREIAEITWRTQASAEHLPASAKPALLESEAPRVTE